MNYRKRYKEQAKDVLETRTPDLNFDSRIMFSEQPKKAPFKKWVIYVPVFSGVAALGLVLTLTLGLPKAYDSLNTPRYYINSPGARMYQDTWTRGSSLDIYNHFVATFSPLVFNTPEAFDAKSFSPVDAFVNVAILGYISTGNSQSEILTALGVASTDELNQVVKDVIDVLGSGAGYSLNSFWYDQNIYTLREGSTNLLETLASHYYTNIIAARPTTDLVNEWLNIYVPKDRFPIIPEVELDENGADAAIVSSYFARSGWSDESLGQTFKDEYLSGNHKMTFYGKTNTEVNYIEHGGKKIILDYCQGVEITLEAMKINFFLPDLENSVSGIFESALEGNYQTADIIGAHVPYFKIDNRLDLIDPLRGYGVNSVFDISAGQGLLNNQTTVVTSIEQFSTMSFDFGGLYSASVTVTQMNETAGGDFFSLEKLILDRPFVFTASYHGATILVGQVYNPNY